MGGSETISIAVALLALFLVLSTALKYAVRDNFHRTRLIMTLFFFFIIITLTMAFWRYTLASLPSTIPAALAGVALGYVAGVREAQRKLMEQGVEFYREHFHHVHFMDIQNLSWWSVINFYSVMGALVLINLVGLSTVFFVGRESWAIASCVVGALLLGSLVPYLVHLWSLPAGKAGIKAAD